MSMRSAFVTIFGLLYLVVPVLAQQVFSLNEQWEVGAPNGEFQNSPWKVAFHPTGLPPYTPVPVGAVVDPWTIETVGGWQVPGYTADSGGFPISGIGKIDITGIDHQGKDLPEDSIAIFERGGALLTVPNDVTQAIVQIEAWQARQLFGTPFIFLLDGPLDTYSDGDALGNFTFGNDVTSSNPMAYERTFTNVTAGQVIGITFGGADYHGANVTVTLTDAVGPTEWIKGSGGNWNNGVNWSFSVPNGINAAARLGNGISSSSTIFTDDDITVRTIELDNATASYNISGIGSVNLQSSSVEIPPQISVLQGSHQFQAAVNLHNDTQLDISSGATLTFNNTLNLMGNSLTKSGGGTLALRNDLVLSGGTLNVQQGTVSGNGTLGGDINNAGGTISPGNSNANSLVVPEPATIAVVYLSGILLLLRRPRGTRR